jgi:hypothetical protein
MFKNIRLFFLRCFTEPDNGIDKRSKQTAKQCYHDPDTGKIISFPDVLIDPYCRKNMHNKNNPHHTAAVAAFSMMRF